MLRVGFDYNLVLIDYSFFSNRYRSHNHDIAIIYSNVHMFECTLDHTWLLVLQRILLLIRYECMSHYLLVLNELVLLQ